MLQEGASKAKKYFCCPNQDWTMKTWVKATNLALTPGRTHKDLGSKKRNKKNAVIWAGQILFISFFASQVFVGSSVSQIHQPGVDSRKNPQRPVKQKKQ